MNRTPRLRCAVYTRKSTEEGLDQEFNSLDAQREACAAFIASQAGLGWKLVPDRYDDGGISGGTMERPALQRLLQDIRDRKVDVVVVYKIDRLTRSLMDFSKIVEIFDASNASCVSVTQQFNTTTSMGRLTLNVLLSFAQFEREVTAERIRDKIAASKAKGMWMGGRVPFGYRVEDRKLVIDDQGADTVRWMFNRFLELRSVSALTREIDRSGKIPVSGQGTLSRGRICWLLANPLYIGKLRHRGKIHDGEHQPIIDADLFERVQRQLADGSPRRSSSSNSKDTHLLTGIVFDETGERLSPTATSAHGKRYRYYVSSRLVRSPEYRSVATRRGEGHEPAQRHRHDKGKSDGQAFRPGNGLRQGRGIRSKQGWRIKAERLDRVAVEQLRSLLIDKVLISDWLRQHAAGSSTEDVFRRAEALSGQIETDQIGQLRRDLVQKIFARIMLSPTKITFHIQPQPILGIVARGSDVKNSESAPEGRGNETESGAHQRSVEKDQSSALPIYVIELPIVIRRRGQEQRIVIESSIRHEPDASLVDLLGRAHFYLQELTAGSITSITGLADHLNVHRADISRILPLAFLSPAITDAILLGKQPAHLTPNHLARLIDVPSSWGEQARALGM